MDNKRSECPGCGKPCRDKTHLKEHIGEWALQRLDSLTPEQVQKASKGKCQKFRMRLQLGTVDERRLRSGAKSIVPAVIASATRIPSCLLDMCEIERSGLTGTKLKEATQFVNTVPCVMKYLQLPGVERKPAERFFVHCSYSILATTTLPPSAHLGVTTVAVAVGILRKRIDDVAPLLDLWIVTRRVNLTLQDSITYLHLGHDLYLPGVKTKKTHTQTQLFFLGAYII